RSGHHAIVPVLIRRLLAPHRRVRSPSALTLPELVFFFPATATSEIYTLSLHDALPISPVPPEDARPDPQTARTPHRWSSLQTTLNPAGGVAGVVERVRGVNLASEIARSTRRGPAGLARMTTTPRLITKSAGEVPCAARPSWICRPGRDAHWNSTGDPAELAGGRC